MLRTVVLNSHNVVRNPLERNISLSYLLEIKHQKLDDLQKIKK